MIENSNKISEMLNVKQDDWIDAFSPRFYPYLSVVKNYYNNTWLPLKTVMNEFDDSSVEES